MWWPFGFKKGGVAKQLPTVESVPLPTEQMERLGFHWRKLPCGEWIEACNTCGGNCGQCGVSMGMNPLNQPSLEAVIENWKRED